MSLPQTEEEVRFEASAYTFDGDFFKFLSETTYLNADVGGFVADFSSTSVIVLD